MTPSFYQTLRPMTRLTDLGDGAFYVPAPTDWHLACADIEGSTALVKSGQQPPVNFASAGVITALCNLCGVIPYQFGGDGACALLPPEFAAAARRELARLRGFARNELKVNLRVGLIPIATLAEAGARIEVSRFELSPGNMFANFQGDGIARFEAALKGRGDASLAGFGMIGAEQDDGQPSDLTGLTCRWDPLRAEKGRILSLVVQCQDVAGLIKDLLRITRLESPDVASVSAMRNRWPPKGLLREARARRRNGSLAAALTKTGLETAISFILFAANITIGGIDPDRYRRETMTNLIHFSRNGAAFNIVFDCPTEHVAALRDHLEAQTARGGLRYGMHVTDSALMTCFVGDITQGQHVHFADGNNGGYTLAAAALKMSAQGSTPAPDA